MFLYFSVVYVNYTNFHCPSSGNAAYGKDATQSGHFDGYVASRAVDGNTNPSVVDGRSCAHPVNDEGGAAWWSVDLGDIYTVYDITLFTRDTLYGKCTVTRYPNR